MKNKNDWTFLHAVKTGGIYIQEILNSQGFSVQRSHKLGTSDYYKNKKVLICKRNPYDRVNSMFYFYREKRSIIPKHTSLKDFVMGMFDEKFFKKKHAGYTYQQLMAPLTTIAKDANGNIQADYILDFHDLDNSLSEFFLKFGIKHRPEDPKNNNDQKPELDLSLWDREMIDKINQIYSEDFEFFGYKKQ